MMIAAAVGAALLLIGLIRKIKFLVKLGLIAAVVAFLANGGLSVLF